MTAAISGFFILARFSQLAENETIVKDVRYIFRLLTQMLEKNNVNTLDYFNSQGEFFSPTNCKTPLSSYIFILYHTNLITIGRGYEFCIITTSSVLLIRVLYDYYEFCMITTSSVGLLRVLKNYYVFCMITTSSV